MKKLVVILSIVCSLNFIQAREYLSAVAAISTKGFASLQSALTVAKNQLPITVQPIDDRLSHLTLIGFDLGLQDDLSFSDKSGLTNEIKMHLANAAHDAIKKSLQHLKNKNNGMKEPIRLRFCHVELFKKKIVGIFESTGVVDRLRDTIRSYFHNNIRSLVGTGLITSVKEHQKIVLPHVTLAKLPNAHRLFGTQIQVQGVEDFVISRAESFSTVQLRAQPMSRSSAAAAAV